MTSNLDKTDILILQTLQKDASLTNKQLAAKVHLSRESLQSSMWKSWVVHSQHSASSN